MQCSLKIIFCKVLAHYTHTHTHTHTHTQSLNALKPYPHHLLAYILVLLEYNCFTMLCQFLLYSQGSSFLKGLDAIQVKAGSLRAVCLCWRRGLMPNIQLPLNLDARFSGSFSFFTEGTFFSEKRVYICQSVLTKEKRSLIEKKIRLLGK